MLLGAEGCQKCKCKPCVPCTAECDPDTPVGFQVVYSNGNDGFLDSDESANPVNLFPAPVGPFHSEITNDIAINMPSDEFACSFRLLLWRNVFDKVGTPSEELSVQRLRISCSSGRVQIGDLFLNAGESILVTTEDNPATDDTYVIDGTWVSNVFDLVAGLDDQSGNPPPLLGGLSAVPLCTPAVVNVQARIAWTSPDIHHVLYGQFLECYDRPIDPPTCERDCPGTGATVMPPNVFITISNTTETPTNPSGATYTLPEIAGSYNVPMTYCVAFADTFELTGGTLSLFAAEGLFGSPGVFFQVNFPLSYLPAWSPGRGYASVSLTQQEMLDLLCNGAPVSGTATIECYSQSPAQQAGIGGTPLDLGTIEFDWELSW